MNAAPRQRSFSMLLRLFVPFVFFVVHSLAHAQSWPAKPIKIIVPYPPGGTSDILARALSPGLQAALGQPIVVENKPGATGNVGADFVAKSPPDGYTLLMGHIGTLAVAPSLYPKLPYDPRRDFAQIGRASCRERV